MVRNEEWEEELTWKEKRVEDSVTNHVSYKSAPLDREGLEMYGIKNYYKVWSDILKDKNLSPNARYVYVWLIRYTRYKKGDVYEGKSVIGKNSLKKISGLGLDTIDKGIEELKRAGVITAKLKECDYQDDTMVTVYEFIKLPTEDSYFERITTNFLDIDRSILSNMDKRFIVMLMPYIYKEIDMFGYSNAQLADLTGYSASQVGRFMRSFKKMGLVEERKKRRRFDLLKVMCGLSDTIDVLRGTIESQQEYINKLERKLFMYENASTEKEKELIRNGDVLHFKYEDEVIEKSQTHSVNELGEHVITTKDEVSMIRKVEPEDPGYFDQFKEDFYAE